jgi:hypothetical protein
MASHTVPEHTSLPSEVQTAPILEYKSADQHKARLVATVELKPLDTTLPWSIQYDARHEGDGQNAVASTQTEGTLKPQPAALTSGFADPVQAPEAGYDVFGELLNPVREKKGQEEEEEGRRLCRGGDSVSESPVEQNRATNGCSLYNGRWR